MPGTCLIVLNWNRPHDTIRCLASILATLTPGDDVSIVCCDNASTDDSVAQIAAWAREHEAVAGPSTDHDPGFRFWLVRTDENGGYAAGNNAAIDFALTRDAFEFVWILNNDTVVEAGALAALLDMAQSAQHERTAILGSTIVRLEAPDVIECAGGFRYLPALTVTRPLLAGAPRTAALSAPRNPRLDAISGAATFIRTTAWRAIGPLDERFFLYCEELDYAARARAAGWSIAWCPHSVVRHRGAASTGGRSRSRNRGSTLSAYHENLSHLRYTRKHHPGWRLPVAWLARLAMKTAAAVAFWRWHTIRPLLRAYRDFGRYGTSCATARHERHSTQTKSRTKARLITAAILPCARPLRSDPS